LPEFEDKFIAYIDILGFKNLVAEAEIGSRVRLSDVLNLLDKFKASADQNELATYGALTCPGSAQLSHDVGFRATQVSDSVIVSVEASPCGLATLIGKCWGVTVRFLLEGVLCRGYVTRGSIFHVGTTFVGTGYQRAYQQEPRVTVFGRPLGQRGTPFVEIDPLIMEYVNTGTDSCLQNIYAKCVVSDGEYAALFPFTALQQSFVIGGIGENLLDYDEIRQGNVGLRHDIEGLKNQLWANVDKSNARAVAHVEHYARALDRQLRACDHVDRVLDMLGTPRNTPA